jgi:hypothetical protein
MGLPNAVITKISKGEIRTTHVTGIVTDIGVELGTLLYRTRKKIAGEPPVMADRARLALLVMLLAASEQPGRRGRGRGRGRGRSERNSPRRRGGQPPAHAEARAGSQKGSM